jgi:hypothetical protein
MDLQYSNAKSVDANKAFSYEIKARKLGETRTYIRHGEERVSALSSDLARQGWRVTVRVLT